MENNWKRKHCENWEPIVWEPMSSDTRKYICFEQPALDEISWNKAWQFWLPSRKEYRWNRLMKIHLGSYIFSWPSCSGNFHLSLWLVLKFGTCQSERLSLLLDNHQVNYITKLKRKKSCAWAFILRQFQTRVVEEASINNFALGNSNILNGSSKDDCLKWKKIGILLLNSWRSFPITPANATETLDWDFWKHCIVQFVVHSHLSCTTT
jgi:hypothetical protein